MSAAEELRTAARLMRERAQAATEDALWVRNWGRLDETSLHINYRPHVFASVHAGSAENREHIASWHPAVALAVADWLDACAEFEAHLNHGSSASDEQRWRPHQYEQALIVARTYLGAT